MTASAQWETIWNARPFEGADYGLTNLIHYDGFDTGFGAIPEDSWTTYVQNILRTLGYRAGDSILDVGCGSGAFLKCISPRPGRAVGVDYSQPHLDVAAKALGDGYEFHRMAAIDIHAIPGPFRFVVCNSVFQYLPDHEYAETVLAHMLTLCEPGGTVAVLDLIDAAFSEEIQQQRIRELGPAKYEELYGHLRHLAFERRHPIALPPAPRDLEVTVEPQDIVGYANGRYRFNLFVRREARERPPPNLTPGAT
jgi:SAM-dependent methyltransferase